MTDQEQIEQLKEANETWRKQWTNSRYEVEQLKAQVNCLRVALMRAITFREDSPNYGNPEQVLEATPEQCLAEVKAMAIEEAIKQCCFESIGGEICYAYALKSIANTFREQAK